MIDYSKGKIYKLEPISGESECYIGSTCSELDDRKKRHENQYNDTTVHKCTSRLLFDKHGINGVKITLIEDYPCENREQLHKREGEWQVKTPNCVNKNIAGRGQKQYYQDTRDTRLEYQNRYYGEHKQQARAYQDSWRAENKESYKKSYKKYYQDNKERLKQKYQDKKEHCKEQYRMKKEEELQSEKDEALKNKIEIDRIKALDNKTHYHCGCGSIVMAPNKSLHLKSKKHMKYEEECDNEL